MRKRHVATQLKLFSITSLNESDLFRNKFGTSKFSGLKLYFRSRWPFFPFTVAFSSCREASSSLSLFPINRVFKVFILRKFFSFCKKMMWKLLSCTKYCFYLMLSKNLYQSGMNNLNGFCQCFIYFILLKIFSWIDI